MTLPLLLSVPHAGLEVPLEVREQCLLNHEEIVRDGDEGAAEIYDLADAVKAFVTTSVARAIVDMNRAEDDFRADGVVKTHTCWNVPVYRQPLSVAQIERLLAEHHRPYHRQLADRAREGIVLGVDCHTMAAVGPPIGPGSGRPRPLVCLSNADGTCPDDWLRSMQGCFAREFGEVRVNDPFQGGHIIRSRPGGIPWLQLELSRQPQPDNQEKRRRVLRAFTEWCRQRNPIDQR
jgi:formiminoglutamase